MDVNAGQLTQHGIYPGISVPTQGLQKPQPRDLNSTNSGTLKFSKPGLFNKVLH